MNLELKRCILHELFLEQILACQHFHYLRDLTMAGTDFVERVWAGGTVQTLDVLRHRNGRWEGEKICTCYIWT